MVRRFQQVAGFPSNATMIHAMLSNSIKNSPITKRDIELTAKMLGPSKYSLQGKRTARTPDAIDGYRQVVPAPDTVREFYSNVELCVDVMFVNDVPFLSSLSKHIHFGTIDALDNLSAPVLENQNIT